ncbi:MAG TPA: nitroreductase family deazaflavin-dependent oxidoreductase [Actinomycetota bacterium]|nr:nitroreductase family deazaflavin-dependent oxidoreductase [Actinomycetota bacterium]
MGPTDDQKRFPRAAAWFASRRWGRNLSAWIYTPLDKLLYRVTRGRRGLSPPATVLLLTTVGRKTGQPRQVPVLYLRDGRRMWVVASNYGQERHPAWSANLLANPHATVTIRGTRQQVRARLATEDEKAALWPRLLELYPAWKAYVTWTDRSFRVFCLEPRGPT